MYHHHKPMVSKVTTELDLSSQKIYILNFTEKRLPYRVEPHLVSLLFVLILQVSDNLIFALYYQFFVFAVSVIPICAIKLKM